MDLSTELDWMLMHFKYHRNTERTDVCKHNRLGSTRNGSGNGSISEQQRASNYRPTSGYCLQWGR